jgi:nitrate reductase gamma subunit
MAGSYLMILTYVSVIVFLVGLIYRAFKILSMPVHLRWELSPVPHEKGRSRYGGSYFEEYEWWTKKRAISKISELFAMAQEIVLLKGVWEHNRKLWFFSFPFHFGGLYLVAGMAGLWGLGALLGILELKYPWFFPWHPPWHTRVICLGPSV